MVPQFVQLHGLIKIVPVLKGDTIALESESHWECSMQMKQSTGTGKKGFAGKPGKEAAYVPNLNHRR